MHTNTQKKSFYFPKKKEKKKKIEFERISHLLNLGENKIHNNENVYKHSINERTYAGREKAFSRQERNGNLPLIQNNFLLKASY